MHRRCLKRSKKLTGEKVTFSKSRSSDVSFCKGFWFLMFAAANIDYWFLHFFTFSPCCFLVFCCCFEKLHLSWRVCFLYFFLPTFFPVKPENEQGRRTSLEKFTRSVVSSFSFPSSLSSELHFSLGGMWTLNLLHLLFLQIASLQLLF